MNQKQEDIVWSTFSSPLGIIYLEAEHDRLTGLWLEGQKSDFSQNGKTLDPCYPVFVESAAWLERYFRGEKPAPKELSLSMSGTAFQKEVWSLLLQIPYGHTCTYGEIGKELAKRRGLKRMSAQAVGGAVGRNPISIIVPCHRVIGADGSLTGYAGGIEKKRWLLCHEGVHLT